MVFSKDMIFADSLSWKHIEFRSQEDTIEEVYNKLWNNAD